MSIMSEAPIQTSSTAYPDSSTSYDSSRFNVKPNERDIAQIVKWAQEKFKDCKAARISNERQWKLNLAFYYGQQHVIFKGPYLRGHSGTLYTPPAPYFTARPVINRIRAVVRRDLARLTVQKPTASVIPSSTEDLDMYAARCGEQIWSSIFRNMDLSAEIRNTLFWTLTCGDGYLKTYWDPNKIDTYSDQMGDFCFESETPFHVFVPDLRQVNLEKQPYLIHAQIKPRDSIQMRFPGIRVNDNTKTALGREEIIEDQYLNLTGQTNAGDKDTVMVLEVWIKPGAIPLFPSGAMFTVVDDQLVQGVEGWPYAHKMYPFAKFGHIISGKYYCDSTVTDLISLQREFNRTRGQIIENKNRMGKQQLLAVKGSVDPRKITSEPGIVIEYEPGYEPPQPLPLMPLPNYVLQEVDRILADMADISGQHEVSKGNVPPGVTAATAISYLQEQDESMLSTTFASLEEAIQKTARMVLSLVSEFWDTKRMVKITGTDEAFTVEAFKGADLRNNADVRIEAGSSLPTSKAAKQAFILDLMKLGFIAPDKGLEVMEIGGLAKLYDEIRTDVREAQRENLKMSAVTEEQLEQFRQLQLQMATMNIVEGSQSTPAGISGVSLIVPVNKWNNDQVHINTHDMYRKSQAFDRLPQHVKDLFDQHVQMHVDQMIQAQLAQVPDPVIGEMEKQGINPNNKDAGMDPANQLNLETNSEVGGS